MTVIRTAEGAFQFADDQRFQNEGISSYDVANYSDSVLFMFISDVRTPIPAFNPTSGMPGQWRSGGDGTLATVDMRFEFENPAKSGQAIIYFRKQINCVE